MVKKMGMMKRTLSLTLALLMTMSLCVVSAEYQEVIPTPEIGITFFDDYESYSQRSDAVGGTPYASGGGNWPVTDQGNKLWRTQVNGAASSWWYEQKSGSSEIDSGQLIISATVSVDGGYTGTAAHDDGAYPTAYLGYWTLQGGTLPWLAITNTSDTDTTKTGAFSWNGAYNLTTSAVNGNDVVRFSADVPHDIAMVIDYTEGKTYYYLDGALVGQRNGARTIIDGMQLGLVADKATDARFPVDANGNRPHISVDNFKMERNTLDAVTATASYGDANHVTIDFSTGVACPALDAEDIQVVDSVGDMIAVTSYTFNTARDCMTLTLANEPEEGHSYTINFGQSLIHPYVNASKEIQYPLGGLSFVVPLRENVVLEQDFEDVTFPSSDDVSDVDWLETSVSDGPVAEGVGYGNMSNWDFDIDPCDYSYVQEVSVNNSRALRFRSRRSYNSSQSSQSIVLPFTEPVHGGIVTVEFDAEFISSSGTTRYAIGLRDTEDDVGGFNPWQTWGDATYLGGLTYWSGTRKMLTMNSSDKPNMLPDGYLYYNTPTLAGNNPASGTWKEHASVLNNNFMISDDISSLGTGLQTFKYVLDLDNGVYAFYLDDELQGTMPYIPGGESGTYDAFVATIFTPTTSVMEDSTEPMDFYLDNVKVTQNFVVPELISAGMTDCNDEDTVLADGLSGVFTGILQAYFDFNIPVSPVTVQEGVVVTASNGWVNHTISAEGGKIKIDFSNGLNANTTYTITIANVASMNGHVMTQPQSYTFTTGAGAYEIVGPSIYVDGAPIANLKDIREDSVVTGNVVFLNTAAGTPRGGTIYMAAYRDETLMGSVTATMPAASGVRRLQVHANALANGFYQAESIRVFLFADETLDQTLVEPFIFPNENYAVASFSSYTDTNDAISKTAINSAKLGSGEAPTLATAGTWSGWQLDPGSDDGAYIAVDIAGSFTGGLDTDETIRVEVDYINDSYGSFVLIYQGTDGEQKGLYEQMNKSGGWKQATFILEDASFADDCNGYDLFVAVSDARLTNYRETYRSYIGTSTVPDTIGAIRIYKENTISPFDITVETGHAGNVFVYPDHCQGGMNFDISYDDPKGKYTSGTAEYVVKNYNGVTVWSKTQNFTGGHDTLNIPYGPTGIIKYGLYTIDINVTGANNISQHKLVDFSISLKGETNSRYGGNIHLDWEAYSQEDVMDIVDLVKASGLGFTRTKVTWNDIEPNLDGNYQVPDNTLFANQYIDQVGLENLCILDHTHWKTGETGSDGKTYFTLTDATNRTKFADFCAWVVAPANYGQYTNYFSLLNEYNLQGPNVWHQYDNYYSEHQVNSYANYVQIAQEAYTKIKAANPNARVITGELGRYEREWIDAAYAAGLGNYSDIFSYHIYEYSTGPEYFANYRDTTNNWWVTSPWASARDAYNRITTGYGDRAWVTETGLSMRENAIAENICGSPSTIDKASKWIPRYYALLGWELDKVFAYAFTDNNTDFYEPQNNYGIVRAHDYRTPFAAKPAYIGLSALNYFTGGAGPVTPNFIGTEADLRERGFVMKYGASNHYPDGVVMAWKGERAGTKTAYPTIAGANTLVVYDWMGNYVKTISNGEALNLVEEPYYIIKNN